MSVWIMSVAKPHFVYFIGAFLKRSFIQASHSWGADAQREGNEDQIGLCCGHMNYRLKYSAKKDIMSTRRTM